jgi:hypothetical protein
MSELMSFSKDGKLIVNAQDASYSASQYDYNYIYESGDSVALSSLKVWYDAKDSSTTSSKLYDLSGSGNDASIFGASINTSGGYVSFDGVNDYINAGNDSSLGFSSTNQLTLEIWLRNPSSSNNSDTYGRVADYGDTTISIGSYNNYELRNWVNAGGSRSSEIRSGSTGYADDTWHHIFFSYNGSTFQVWVDGVSLGSISKSGSLESGQSLTLGVGDNDYWHGDIAIFRAYNLGLSSVEAKRNFNVERKRFGV